MSTHTRTTIAAAWLAAAALALAPAGCNSEDGERVPARTAGATKAPPTDGAIAAAVRSQLELEHALDANAITVSVVNGVATLKGTADNLIAKERAVLRTEMVRGVRAVSDRIKVKRGTREDSRIGASIRKALLRNPATEAFEIEARVDEGSVHLTGSVDSYAEKMLAEQVVKGVAGVTAVENAIIVRYTPTRPDFEIEKDIAQRLEWDARVDPGVYVDVVDGRAVLYGTVGSLAEKRRAAADAWVNGVHTVDDSGLAIHPWARDPHTRSTTLPYVSDAELERAVRDALVLDPRVLGGAVSVDSTGGVVTLEGTVSTRRQRLVAEELAHNTVGVIDVDNQIEVGMKVPPADDLIARNVRAALVDNPFTEAHEIGVGVDRGVATLTGTVDSVGEKLEAEDVANGVRGVIMVKNQIEVEDSASSVVYEPLIHPYYPYIESWELYAPGAPDSADDEIERAIGQELFWSPDVDAGQVEVKVEDGKAVLTGRVDSYRELLAAETNALEGGAVEVDNQLEVIRGTGERSGGTKK